MIEGLLTMEDLRALSNAGSHSRLDYEQILIDCKNSLQEIINKDAQLAGVDVLSLPLSDPLIKVLEVAAYRELLIRQQINEAISACYLDEATGKSLHNLAALVTGKHIPTPAKAVGSTYDQIRENVLGQYREIHTAGTREAYQYYVRHTFAKGKVHDKVYDVAVSVPSPGVVKIAPLFHPKLHAVNAVDQNSPNEEFMIRKKLLLDRFNKINDSANESSVDHDIRPIGHKVEIDEPVIHTYQVKAKLGIPNAPGKEQIVLAATKAAQVYMRKHYQLGKAIYRSALLAAIQQPGVEYIVLEPLNDGLSNTADITFEGDYASKAAPWCRGIGLLDDESAEVPEDFIIAFDDSVPEETVTVAQCNGFQSKPESKISCELVITAPDNVVRLTHYVLYWASQGDTNTGYQKLTGSAPFAVEAVGEKQTVLQLTDITQPEKAIGILIFTANFNGESEKSFFIKIPPTEAPA